ncbi:transposase [Natronobacterium gregoryi]|nr:transposase [Natronobacterium gregoryi]
MTRVRPAFRDHVRYLAAECAVKAEDYELETAADIRENPIADHQNDDGPDVDPIGEMEQEIKEDAYTIQADIIRDICSYDRDKSFEWDGDLITDSGAHMCRRNDYAEEGIERMAKDYGLIEEHDDGTEDWNVFTPQTFRRTVRDVERTKIEGYDWDNEDAYGARWLPAHDLVDPAIVRGDLRDALEEAWTIDPHDPDGETATWHLRTEDAIERQIEWLRDEQGVIDDDTFNLRIDYTTHDHSRHSSVKSDPPIGVHKQSHLDTGYAWKELQGTIKINGRAFIIASLSYTPQNDQFQAVRYILDRARDLVNIDTVMADAEFVDTKICRYIRQIGCDYAIRKGATNPVKETVADFDGRADWDSNWTLSSSGRRRTHNTTLVGLEKDFKSVPDHKKKDDEEDEPDTTLDDFGDDEDEGVPEGQLTLDQAIEEPHKDKEEIDYFCIITSKTVDGEGIDPDNNPVAHDPEGTAWGIGRLYRDRWGIETAFRDKKKTFAAKTRSRDLGYRRFLWMMENLLYNGWVMLNTAVADQSPDRDDDEIVVKQATYLDELDRRVLSGLSLDLEFPDVGYG